ncbi:aminotransferase-like domain-containing protein [Granulicella cerasi]|uniref:aminotransferase-like domain-containing protein n=1 Tax=Granulicella cerasi TaxID=741063 RepID=UPI0021E0D4F9|nr:PLP-dependent aminotransferase family protein [Granulicella cerasi]
MLWNMIEMQYNFPLLPGLAEVWATRFQQVVSERLDMNSLRPSFRQDVRELVKVGAGWLRVPMERTWLTEGTHHAALIAMLSAGLAGKAIAVDGLSYSGALDQMRMLGCEIVGCAMDTAGMMPESLLEACELRGVKAIYLMPTVQNPLGATMPAARRQELLAVAREFDLVVLEDDAYGFMDASAPTRLVEMAPERVFLLTALSKSFVPAARSGWLVAPERWGARVESAVKATATGVSLPHARAAASLIADGTVDRVIAEKNAEGAIRNAAARAVLGEWCAEGVGTAWHLWVDVPTGTSEAFEAKMRELEVLVSGGNWFATREDAPQGVRVALGGEVERERMMVGVERIAEALRLR